MNGAEFLCFSSVFVFVGQVESNPDSELEEWLW
jgi:hypothetical protein